ncbi:MAG TPA: hypothetical protein VKA84_13995 [Gemmatimonadaceae bacterium]|nr:hypothetical protein [Gemmatimonadaceae bacterium]
MSTKFTPRSIARCSERIDSASSVVPHASPPIAQAPKLMAEIRHPVRPSSLYSMSSLS